MVKVTVLVGEQSVKREVAVIEILGTRWEHLPDGSKRVFNPGGGDLTPRLISGQVPANVIQEIALGVLGGKATGQVGEYTWRR